MIDNKLLLTTSDNIPFSKIEKHLGVVDSQVVVGANVFRDFFAGVRDIVGGESKGYMKDLDKMKNAAKRNLISQATDVGANAVISLRMDLNEVSGGGKSMFMFIIYGSAVKVEQSFFENEVNSSRVIELSNEDLEYYKNRNKLKKKINSRNDKVLSIDIDVLSKYNLWSFELLKNKLRNFNNDNIETYNEKYKDKIISGIKTIPVSIINQYLESEIDYMDSELWDVIIEALKASKWYDLHLIKALLKDENHLKRFRALRLCRLNKEFYVENDANILKEIGTILLNDFDHSYPVREVDKMIGKKHVFTCPYCLRQRVQEASLCKCGTNEYGLKPTSLAPDSIATELIEYSEAIKSAFES